MALELIAKHERIGRKQLAKELDIGEGSMRTILNQLKKQNLITSSRGGHALTAKGRRLLGKAPKFIQIDVGGLAVGKVSVATLVKKAGKKVKRGIEQRDAAIKAGADGATALVFRGGKFRFPDGFLGVKKAINESLVKVFGPSEGDVLIIGSASDPLKAERGARASAETLV
jgi:DNA-binding MarR family transcriptional regulator